MATTAEKLKFAAVVDDLQREEAALSNGGAWNAWWWDTGRCTPTGWTNKEGEKYATAIYVASSRSVPDYLIVSLAKPLTIGRGLTIHLNKEGESTLSLDISYVSAEKVKLTLGEMVEGSYAELASAEVEYKEGDRYALTAEEGAAGLKAWRQIEAEGEFAEILNAETPGLEPFGDNAALELYGSTTTSTQRITGFSFGTLVEPTFDVLPEATNGIRFSRYQIATALTDAIKPRDDYFICQWWETTRIAAAKAQGARVLIYQNLTRAHEPNSETGRYSTGLTLKEAEELGATSTDEDPDSGQICLPGTEGYAALWLERALEKATAAGADGIFCDDLVTPNDGASEISDAEWLEQMEACNAAVGPGITGAGLIAVANMAGATGQRNVETEGWLEGQFQYFDGGLDEFFVTWPGGEVQPSNYIEEAIGIMRRQQARGKFYIACSNGAEDVARFALALCLLHTAGGVQFFATPDGDFSKESRYAFYSDAVRLGLPTAEVTYSYATDEFSREFEGGAVSVTFATETGTIPESSLAVTYPASSITPVKATLGGTVDPARLPTTTYWFEYGETEAYGQTTPKVEGLEEAASVSAEITGLHPHTTYHFRLVAENEEGEVAGEDATFTTAPPRQRPVPQYLQWELCDLEQNVLTRLDNRLGGARVELGLNAGRRAFCPLSLDDPALEVAKAIATVLRVTLKGADDFSLPLFIGRVVIPERNSEPEKRELGLYALDPFFQLERALIREVAGSVWSAKTFAGIDQSAIMWALIAAASGHGVIEGDLPASVSRDRTYPPGKEVGPALIEMSEVIGGPDFELEPLAGEGTSTLAQFNTHYPRQGSDLSTDVVFVHGKAPYTAKAFSYSPGGEEIANRVLAIGAPREQEGEVPYAEHPGYVAEHVESIEENGPFEKRLQLEEVTETPTLESYAKGAVAAAAYPIPYFDFTAAPEKAGYDGVGAPGVPPRFGIDYWLGDTVGVEHYADPDGEPLELTGRVTDAVVTERASRQIEVKATCAPEVSSTGVTGEAVTVRVPEGEEE